MSMLTCLESFHRVLKYCYQRAKVNKRMDKTIHLLLKYARDKSFDRLIKTEKREKIQHECNLLPFDTLLAYHYQRTWYQQMVMNLMYGIYSQQKENKFTK